MANFADRLKELRKNKNLTQKSLGEIIGLTERGVQSYELETTKPSYDMLTTLADYFDVSVDYLIGRSDNPERR